MQLHLDGPDGWRHVSPIFVFFFFPLPACSCGLLCRFSSLNRKKIMRPIVDARFMKSAAAVASAD